MSSWWNTSLARLSGESVYGLLVCSWWLPDGLMKEWEEGWALYCSAGSCVCLAMTMSYTTHDPALYKERYRRKSLVKLPINCRTWQQLLVPGTSSSPRSLTKYMYVSVSGLAWAGHGHSPATVLKIFINYCICYTHNFPPPTSSFEGFGRVNRNSAHVVRLI